MAVAVREAGLKLSSRLLGRVRHVADVFRRSATATAVLALKQKPLEHKLIMDIATRRDSTRDMLDGYLGQQAAATTALISPATRHNAP
ncbi:hypothetical protein N1851_003430 [Merluccius polli]|uniref:Uncharacterized protein n=1 Tax=Merluccius polli TaxID=89951 RepID=A0AA47NA67_MERPO|nr:hypothetical protein N1851_015226 [Merluccius polli]KAK0154470.1 hypothetical protein N1851_003430 [Merluccius polli]